MARKNKILIFLSITIIIFVLDRITKFLSSKTQDCFIFCISRSKNYGAAFSLFSQFTWTRLFLIIIALAVLFFAALFYFKTKKLTYLHIGLILLFAGTLGNMFDRLFLGYVIDFIKFSFYMRFPAFNLADVSNIAGVVLLIISLIRRK